MIRSTRCCLTSSGTLSCNFSCRIGAFLLRIGEDPQPLEAYVAHELFQLGEIGLRLAGIADQERRAQRQIGDGSAQAADQRMASALVWRRCMAESWASEMCWNGMSRYLQILGSEAMTSITSSGNAVG